MNKIYIAGRISNYDGFYEHFKRIEEKLKKEGNIVLNPAILPPGLEQQEYMSICIPMLYVADEIYMLGGWEFSMGATIEHGIARQAKMKVTYEDLGGIDNE